MNRHEAKKLKIGDRVQIWAESPDACTGAVIETGYNAVKFDWDDGEVGVIHLNGMKAVSRFYGDDEIVPAVPVAKVSA